MHEDNKRNAMLTKKRRKREKRNKITAEGGAAVIRGCAESRK